MKINKLEIPFMTRNIVNPSSFTKGLNPRIQQTSFYKSISPKARVKKGKIIFLIQFNNSKTISYYQSLSDKLKDLTKSFKIFLKITPS